MHSANLDRNSGPDSEEEIAEIPRDGGGQDGEGVVGPTLGGFGQVCKEEHVDNGDSIPQNFTLQIMGAIAQYFIHKNLDKHARPNPHERHKEIRH